jgi:hypothetical protein
VPIAWSDRLTDAKLADKLFQVPANPPTTDLTVFVRDVPLKLD